MHFRVRGKGRKGKKVRFMAVGPRAQRLIEDYLDAAGHRADLEVPLFQPVKNNSTGLLAKPLNPQSLYESIVLHYAKKVGITTDTHGFACIRSGPQQPRTPIRMGQMLPRCSSGWDMPMSQQHGSMTNGGLGRRIAQRLR
jgi:hypothetical protein